MGKIFYIRSLAELCAMMCDGYIPPEWDDGSEQTTESDVRKMLDDKPQDTPESEQSCGLTKVETFEE